MKQKYIELARKAHEAFDGESNGEVISFLQSLLVAVLDATKAPAAYRKEIYDEMEQYCKLLEDERKGKTRGMH